MGTSVRVTFHQPAPSGDVVKAIAPLMFLLVVVAIVPIALLFDTPSRTAGLAIAVACTLVVGGLMAWRVRSTRRPMTIEAGPDGIVVDDPRTNGAHRLAWDEVSYTFVEGAGGCLLMIHYGDSTLHVEQQPTLFRGPEGFVDLCAIVERHARNRT